MGTDNRGIEMMRLLNRLRGDQRGATAIEYGLIVALIVIASVSAMQSFADKANDVWDYVEVKVTA